MWGSIVRRPFIGTGLISEVLQESSFKVKSLRVYYYWCESKGFSVRDTIEEMYYVVGNVFTKLDFLSLVVDRETLLVHVQSIKITV